MISRPDWMYRPVSIPQLTQIQTEILSLIDSKYNTVFTADGFGIESSQYLGIPLEDLLNHSPSCVDFLRSINLLDRLSAVTLVGTLNGLHAKPAIVHVDDKDWKVTCFALNLPLKNCENSYTVWYETKELEGESIPDSKNSSDPYYFFQKVGGYHEHQLVREIGRWEVSNPAFVNIGIPHRPESLHNELRLLMSLRFSPELFDYLL